MTNKVAKVLYRKGQGYKITVSTLKFPHTDFDVANEMNISLDKFDEIMSKFNVDINTHWFTEQKFCNRACKFINRTILGV